MGVICVLIKNIWIGLKYLIYSSKHEMVIVNIIFIFHTTFINFVWKIKEIICWKMLKAASENAFADNFIKALLI